MIGIFDSGIGGLTVASSISRILPNEQIVYFGDTAHLPYGDKSIDLVKEYSEKITEYLIDELGCKAIVIACNTASAAAYEHLRDKFKGSIPIINVIDPIIEEVVKDSDIKNIGIIATNATINSGVYQEKLSRRTPNVSVCSLSTPMLAPMIEKGFHDGLVSEKIIESYLNDEKLSGIDSLILACTHYPLIKKEINNFYNGKVKLIDSTDAVAEKLKFVLEKENLLDDIRAGENIYYVSDLTDSFQKTAKLFFGGEINLQLKKL